jgi:hypothetical protein
MQYILYREEIRFSSAGCFGFFHVDLRLFVIPLMLQVRPAIRKDGLDVPSPSLFFLVDSTLLCQKYTHTHTHTHSTAQHSAAQHTKLLLLCGSRDRYVNFGTGRKFICIKNFRDEQKNKKRSERLDTRVQKKQGRI